MQFAYSTKLADSWNIVCHGQTAVNEAIANNRKIVVNIYFFHMYTRFRFDARQSVMMNVQLAY